MNILLSKAEAWPMMSEENPTTTSKDSPYVVEVEVPDDLYSAWKESADKFWELENNIYELFRIAARQAGKRP